MLNKTADLNFWNLEPKWSIGGTSIIVNSNYNRFDLANSSVSSNYLNHFKYLFRGLVKPASGKDLVENKNFVIR